MKHGNCQKGYDDAGSARYSPEQLQRTLVLAGVRVRHARKLSIAVFDRLTEYSARREATTTTTTTTTNANANANTSAHNLENEVCVTRETFRDTIRHALHAREYYGEDVLEAFDVACAVHERRAAVLLLLCGTSGTGKSTLASLLASTLGIPSVISTDSVRHVMRSVSSSSRDEDPVLWASTYDASRQAGFDDVVTGCQRQSERVTEALDAVIDECMARNESLIVEGVHLSMPYAHQLMARHAAVLPFVIHISNAEKHKDRFAVRAKYLTLDPQVNRYVKHFGAIKAIQDSLVAWAKRWNVPAIDNTSVDRSVALIHATTLGFLRRLSALHAAPVASSSSSAPPPPSSSPPPPWGDPDALSTLLHNEFERALDASAWSSKGMLAVLRAKRNEDTTTSSASSTPLSTPRWLELSEDGDDTVASAFGDDDEAPSLGDQEEEEEEEEENDEDHFVEL